MKGLSWIFFCAAPFALFCSEDGSGLILCPVYIILGFVFNWIGYIDINIFRRNKKITEEEWTKLHEFWELQYKDRMKTMLARKSFINDEVIACEDVEARRWASIICGHHNACVPTEAIQEVLARDNGFITKKMLEERKEKKDRIQIGKYFLLKTLEEKHHGKRYKKSGRLKNYYYPHTIIEKDLRKIRLSNGHTIVEKVIENEYSMSIGAIWDSLLKEEKEEAIKWIMKYEEKLFEQIDHYLTEGWHDFYSVDIDFD